MLTVDILVDDQAWAGAVPELELATHRALTSAAAGRASGSVCVLLTNDVRVRALNEQFRGQDKPTNVLSFPADEGPGENVSLGDIALAFETMAQEASDSGISLADHLSHLVVHGFLHLLGYDHQTDAEAAEMEGLETAILKSLDIADPYADDDQTDKVRA